MNRDPFDGALDRWLTREPDEPTYAYEDYCDWVDARPDAGYDAESVEDYQRWADMMELQDMEVRGEIAAERAAHKRDDDDRAYWAGL